MAYEPVVYHGQQAFLRSYIRIERAKRAMLLERQFKKMVAIRIYAFSIRICVLSCILYLIGYWLKWNKTLFLYIGEIHCSQFIQECLVAEGISQISFEVTYITTARKQIRKWAFMRTSS